MKKTIMLLLGLCLLGIASPAWAQEAKAQKRSEPADPVAKAEQKAKRAEAAPQGRKPVSYDANRNGQLDAGEIEVLKKDFANKQAPAAFAKFDRNGNGRLDAPEAKALKNTFDARAGNKTGQPEQPKKAERQNKTRPAKPGNP